jgi:hypothetical protein
LLLHGTSVGDSLLLIALVHTKAEAWLTSVQVLRNDEIMDPDLNRVLSSLQDVIADELNSHAASADDLATP